MALEEKLEALAPACYSDYYKYIGSRCTGTVLEIGLGRGETFKAIEANANVTEHTLSEIDSELTYAILEQLEKRKLTFVYLGDYKLVLPNLPFTFDTIAWDASSSLTGEVTELVPDINFLANWLSPGGRIIVGHEDREVVFDLPNRLVLKYSVRFHCPHGSEGLRVTIFTRRGKRGR